MRFAADTLAPQAIVGAPRRRADLGAVLAECAFTSWPTTGLYGFAATKPCPPMMSAPVNTSHAANITGPRLSEASP